MQTLIKICRKLLPFLVTTFGVVELDNFIDIASTIVFLELAVAICAAIAVAPILKLKLS